MIAVKKKKQKKSVRAVPRSACVIEYDATFVFPVSVAQLWATMARVDCYSSWWSWLDEFSAEGAGLEHGTVLHGIVVPPLPYRMRLDVVVEDCVPERSITALVHGDLEGAAQLTFDGDDTGDAGACDVDYRNDATADADGRADRAAVASLGPRSRRRCHCRRVSPPCP